MRPKNYSHIQQEERDQIAILAAQGASITIIAERIGRNKSTVCRELRRNASAAGEYTPSSAHERAEKRKVAARKRPLLKNDWVVAYVSDKLALWWSPERISGRLARDYPGRWDRNVAAESIYCWLYSPEADPALKLRLARRRKRRGVRDGRGRQKLKIPGRTAIDERSAAINDRSEFGNWEGDTVVSRGHLGGVHTEVERTSRYMRVEKVADGKAGTTIAAQIKIFGPLPAHARKSTTLDNGNEFARHQELHALGMDTYFADPYSSWQRGSNENANGLLRRFFPKGTDFSKVSDEELAECIALINNFPRKCLNWSTSAEVFAILSQTPSVALHAGM